MIRTALVVTLVGGVTVLSAQAPAEQSAPAFEVASVKHNTSGEDRSFYRLPRQGQVSITNGELRRIIAQAYGVDPRRERYLLAAGQDPILSARFDITAKPPDDAPAGQQLAMLQRLLVERFKLRIRRETREMPVYELRPAQEEGRLGPQLRASDHDCRATGTARPPREVCDTEILRSATEKNAFGAGLIVALGIKNAGPISALVSDIQAFADRPVIDLTDLTGNFEWHLTATNPGAVNADYPSVASAVREQLGLRLEPSRGPVEVLVIDSVEQPTPD